MSKTTDAEWEAIQEALVKGGLRETIDRILLTRQDVPTISDENRQMLADAFAGSGGRFTLTIVDNYFTGHMDRELVIEGKEVNGVLYALFHIGGKVEVMVGEQVRSARGVVFDTVAEAWADVERLTAL